MFLKWWKIAGYASKTLGFLCGEWERWLWRNLDDWTVSIYWANLFELREMGVGFLGNFWCYFCGMGVKSDRDLLGFYDTVVDTIGEWRRAWVSMDLLGERDFSVSVEIDLLMLQSRSWICSRMESTPIPYFPWLLIDISGHENIFLW